MLAAPVLHRAASIQRPLALPASPLQFPSLWQPLQLIGATAGPLAAFILPGALALSLSGGRLASARGASGLLLTLCGVMLAAGGLAGLALGA